MSVMQTVVDLSNVCVTVSFSPFETEKKKKHKCKCMSRVTAGVCHHKLFSRMNSRRCRIRSGHHLKLSCTDSPEQEAGSLRETLIGSGEGASWIERHVMSTRAARSSVTCAFLIQMQSDRTQTV